MTLQDRLIQRLGAQAFRLLELETLLEDTMLARESLAAQLTAAQAARPPESKDAKTVDASKESPRDAAE